MSPPVDNHAAVLNALPHPLLRIDEDDRIRFANNAAETFLHASSSVLVGNRLHDFVPFGTPLIGLIAQVRRKHGPTNEYRVDLSSPRIGRDVLVDLHVAPMGEGGDIVVMMQPRGMAEKIDRQLSHRSAARTVTGLASMLAHEIKNPLAGIRGAAQLLEHDADEDSRSLTRLITEEADRIVRMVDRMQVFADDRPVERTALNMHVVLEKVRTAVANGFGRTIAIREEYDPSLPPVFGNRDQLVQVFMNLAKNACEAMSHARDPVLTLRSSFRPGLHLAVAGSRERVSLPLEFSVEDNGPGAPPDVAASMFDAFVTTKSNGSGLGLALVAKIVGDHGGVVEHEREGDRTRFRVLLPTHATGA